ncbi:MAG: hypothetical protein ACFE0Q_01340 [Anaerolineae bacterium]
MNMTQVYTAPKDVEVAGSTTLSFVDNLESVTISDLRQKHGFTQVDVARWYPLQSVFNLFNAIAEQYGTQPFVAMGMKIAQQSEFPPEMLGSVLSLAQVLEGWQAHYEANHRGGTLPPTKTVKLADNHYQIVLAPDHAYPFDLVYGMAYGFCRLLLPKGQGFTVYYEDNHSPIKRNSPEDEVIVNITWANT